jgi:molybdopterin adenylyltransferase
VMDVTTDAVREMIERDLAGIAAMMRMGALTKTRSAALDRLATGLRRKTIIVTFPGDPQRQLIYLDVVKNTIARAVSEVGR